MFYGLEKYKDAIHSEIGQELEWMELPAKKASRIKLTSNGDITDTDQWDNYCEWLVQEAVVFQKVFTKYFKRIKK